MHALTSWALPVTLPHQVHRSSKHLKCSGAMQLCNRAFDDSVVAQADVLALIDALLSDITCLDLLLQACKCVRRLLGVSVSARNHFLTAESCTVAAIYAAVRKLGELALSASVQSAYLGISEVVLALCSARESWRAADDLGVLLQCLFCSTKNGQILVQCCQSMHALAKELDVDMQPQWAEATCRRLLEMQLFRAYDMSVWASLAALTLAGRSCHAAECFLELGAPEALRPYLNIRTDSVLLKHMLDLLAVLASTGPSYSGIEVIQRTGGFLAIVRILREDTWRRNLQPIIVLLQVLCPPRSPSLVPRDTHTLQCVLKSIHHVASHAAILASLHADLHRAEEPLAPTLGLDAFYDRGAHRRLSIWRE